MDITRRGIAYQRILSQVRSAATHGGDLLRRGVAWRGGTRRPSDWSPSTANSTCVVCVRLIYMRRLPPVTIMIMRRPRGQAGGRSPRR